VADVTPRDGVTLEPLQTPKLDNRRRPRPRRHPDRPVPGPAPSIALPGPRARRTVSSGWGPGDVGRRVLREALAGLPFMARRTVELRINGMTFRAINQALGYGPGTGMAWYWWHKRAIPLLQKRIPNLEDLLGEHLMPERSRGGDA